MIAYPMLIFSFLLLVCLGCDRIASEEVPEVEISARIIGNALYRDRDSLYLSVTSQQDSDCWVAVALSRDAFMPDSLAFVSSNNGELSVREMASRVTPSKIIRTQIKMSTTSTGFEVTFLKSS